MMTVTLNPLPMKAAQQFWRDKVLLSPGQYAKLDDAAKVKAFAVSGIARGDELATVFTALQRAVDDGISFDAFKEECQTIFEKRGWSGKAAWRVDNIFRTNIQTAYNVGRYKEMQRVKKTRPFWQYSAVNDSRTRPTHAAMNGKIYPADHRFWDTWYPPNGFRCRCGVITLSQREIDRDGLTVEEKDLTYGLVEPVDPKTGNTMPARSLIPDPGFAHHPGKTVWGGVADAADRPGAWEAMDNLKLPADYRRRALSNVRPADIPGLDESMLLPAGKPDEFYLDEFRRRYGEEKVVRDAAGEPAILSPRAFLIDKTPGAAPRWKFDKAGHGESVPVMEDVLTDPYEIWLTPQKNEDGRIRLAKRYIAVWKTEDKKRIGGMAVYEVVDGVFTGVTSFVPMKKRGGTNLEYLEKQRKGLLLFGR